MSVETPDGQLAHLYPPFAEKVKAILKQATIETMGKHGVSSWIMFEGLRTPARQDYLYSLGRTRVNPDGKNAKHPMGQIVTHKKGSTGNHPKAMAADCYPIDIHGNPMWDAHEEVWQQYGHCVRLFGLQWGGDYPKLTGGTFVDQPHCEPGPALAKEWAAGAKAFLKTLTV